MITLRDFLVMVTLSTVSSISQNLNSDEESYDYSYSVGDSSSLADSSEDDAPPFSPSYSLDVYPCVETKKYTIITTSENWFGALTSCISRGEQLATVRNAKEQKELVNTVTSSGRGSGSYWLNGHNFNDVGQFVWETNPYNNMNFTHWADGQPALHFPLMKCLNIKDDQYWYVNYCYKKNHFICQKIESNCPANNTRF